MAPPSLPQPLGRLPADEHLRRADEHLHKACVFGLPPTPASVGVARRNVRELLSEWGTSRETCDSAVLVTSELVTNALTHTQSEWIVCRLRTAGERLHIEVEDQNRGLTLPAPRRPTPDDQGGRGLLLVGVLSSDWGTRDTAHRPGRIVWAVLPSEPASEPQEPAANGLTATPHLSRPIPHSAEGSLPHGTTARP
ncbi:ATP-binding protein [Streptomyces sp. 2A115]|uniref:ATP-binding protein n=1 Tax=Streptomyces sp. 2A115 TaxID=3457439 RepID=UPI003FD27B45